MRIRILTRTIIVGILTVITSIHCKSSKQSKPNAPHTSKVSDPQLNPLKDFRSVGILAFRKPRDADGGQQMVNQTLTAPSMLTNSKGTDAGIVPIVGDQFIENNATDIVDPGSLRLKIPNPGLRFDPNMNASDTKTFLKMILNNPLMKQKFDNALGNPGVQQGDWRSGCLNKNIKFPTINLKLNSLPLPSNKSVKPQSSKKSQDIRINKFYGVKRDRFYIRNTGNGMISIKFEPEDQTSEATIRGINWMDEYVLAKGDIYWSLDNNHGAQHAIEEQPFAMEIQLVHYAKSHSSLEKAAKGKNGIIITSILLEASGKHNPILEPLARASAAVGFPNNKWRQMHGPLDLKMLFPVDMTYYTYEGQYINEPCIQKATWFVFQRPVVVSYKQLQKFREVRGHDAKRSTGVFLPLFDFKDTMEKERKISSDLEEIYLTVVPEIALSQATKIKCLTLSIDILLKMIAALSTMILRFAFYFEV